MAANFLIRFVVVTTVCALLYGGDVESAGGGHKEGGAGAAHSYPELTKLLKGASLTFRGKVVNLNRLDSTTANDLLKNYFSEDGLEAGLERIVRLAAVNHQIAIQKGLEVDSFEIDELASDENIRILEDMDELESTVNDNKESNDGETHRDKRSVSIGTDHNKWPNTTIAVVIPDVYSKLF
ncbi:uncharacterized protein LOC121384213 [Gigantopelta aegis]|uniref:uncharacterized protein LOC121384213 n=1 Tax=Gigantopelta aegis TaxID=1735272 RepID=UPI001B88E38A|nr:uncharacterized protein LOC121384213 [Gigantopelta aegis]